MTKRILITLAVVAMMTGLLAAPATANGVVTLEFEKELVDPGVWSGTVDGAGGIRTFLTDLDETGKVWHVSFDWFVLEAPEFQAQVTGVVNLVTGNVSLNGTITDGDYEGSNIHVDAQLDLTDLSSIGTMTITP